MIRRRLLFALSCMLVAGLAQSGCDRYSDTAVIPAPTVEATVSPAVLTKPTLSQKGTASWYGGMFHGRKTASGETFNKNEFTAAHRTLPFGSTVRIRNLRNQREVTVEITDRLPRRHRVSIDLSEAAGRALGIKKRGIAQVEITIVRLGKETE